MRPEDLLAMMDLDAAQAAPTAGPDVLTGPAAGPAGSTRPHRPTNPHAVVVDKWAKRRGVDLLERYPDLTVNAQAAADFSAAAFEYAPELTEGCVDPQRQAFVADLLESPEYKALHERTMHDAQASEVAAYEWAKAFQSLQADATDSPVRVMRAAVKAVRAAEQAVELYGETVMGCGGGCGQGTTDGSGTTDPEELLKTYHKVRRSRRLQAIVEQAGRFRRVARSSQQAKSIHGSDETTGVGLGAEVERLLSSELARLAIPGTDMDAARRLLQRQCLQYERRGVEPVGRGPVVVIVDESSSMDYVPGRLATAKGLALAIAWLARRQNRWCCLTAFSSTHDGSGSVLTLPVGGWDQDKLVAWLEHFYAGYTEMKFPFETLPFKVWPKLIQQGATRGKTDLIMITDGACNPSDKQVNEFNAWKKAEQVKMQTLIIGNPETLGRMDEVSDTPPTIVPEITVDGPAAAKILAL